MDRGNSDLDRQSAYVIGKMTMIYNVYVT